MEFSEFLPAASFALATLSGSALRFDAPAFIHSLPGTVMKILPTLVLVLTAAATCAAGAETSFSSQADQERRDRNREEALEHYRAANGTADDRAAPRETLRERTHDTAETVRAKTHRTAQSVRHFTHRQAEKARDFSDRQNARYGMDTKPNTAPEDGVHR